MRGGVWTRDPDGGCRGVAGSTAIAVRVEGANALSTDLERRLRPRLRGGDRCAARARDLSRRRRAADHAAGVSGYRVRCVGMPAAAPPAFGMIYLGAGACEAFAFV